MVAPRVGGGGGGGGARDCGGTQVMEPREGGGGGVAWVPIEFKRSWYNLNLKSTFIRKLKSTSINIFFRR